MSGTSGPRILVPVGDSVTLRNTVAYVVRELTEAPEEGSAHFVFPTHWQTRRLDEEEAEAAEELLDRIRTWVREDLDLDADEALPSSVTTTLIAEDEYLFSYRDYADSLVEYAREHDLDHVVFDPEYNPGGQEPLLSPIEAELDRIEEIVMILNEVVDLSEETMAEAENVAGAAEEQAAELNEVSQRAEDLSRYARPLREVLDRFETESEHEFYFPTGPE